CRHAAARTSDRGNGAVCKSLPRERWMRGRRRGAERSRAAERRRRAPRRSVRLKARNALVARVGLLGLLAQDHRLVAAVDRTRGRLEAECGALREAEPWCGPLRRYEFAWPYLCAPDDAATNDRAYRSRRQPVFRAAKSQVGCPLPWSHSSRSSARLASFS